jgi:hypothetical protein
LRLTTGSLPAFDPALDETRLETLCLQGIDDAI